ncbi:MAG: hypothetical protein ACXIUZ_12295 [Lysobacteraceae bacterium]
MSDIRFIGNDVHIEGNVLKCTTFDIELDNAGRRSNASGKRRALVHDFDDGLTLNWAGDYPGGIRLNGRVRVDHLAGNHLRCGHHDLHLDHPARRSRTAGHRRALVHDFQDGLTLNWQGDYPGGITLAGNILKVTGFDIEFDNAGRRSTAGGKRRAFVHDFQDGLTINWAGDYPGGVTIRGEVKLPQSLTTPRINGSILRLGHHSLHLIHEARKSNTSNNRRALVHDTSDGLTINFAQDYPGGVTIRGPVRIPGSLTIGTKDLMALFEEMQAEIDQLRQRLDALED